MSLIEMLILFLLGLVSPRWFKEVLRAAGNYIIGHRHVGVRNPQAHNDRFAACTSLADTPTLQVEAPRTQQSLKATLLWPGYLQNHDPYDPAYKLFFPKVPAEAPGKKQFFSYGGSKQGFREREPRPLCAGVQTILQEPRTQLLTIPILLTIESCKAGRHLESYTGEWVTGDPVGQQASRHSGCTSVK
uniref:Uncharacterized protein n=1 Tax=Timema poppense TaxID=170557 RepID=A0A7R9DA80_TIMPO|nr:unnamed protein product [Timema poppensis]